MQKNVHVIHNALLTHKIAEMRQVKTRPMRFRELVVDVAMMETYEAMRDFHTISKEIVTPLETYTEQVIDVDNICLVPIMRAGLGMEEGAHRILPNSHTGQIGMFRNEGTHQTKDYFARFPKGIENMDVLLLDPMLATGGSACDALAQLYKAGAKKVIFICIIAAPEGVEFVSKNYPEVPIYIGALDRQLNENAYILPGLGDAGDRIFNTPLDD